MVSAAVYYLYVTLPFQCVAEIDQCCLHRIIAKGYVNIGVPFVANFKGIAMDCLEGRINPIKYALPIK